MAQPERNMSENTPGPGTEGPKLYIPPNKSGIPVGEHTLSSIRIPEPSRPAESISAVAPTHTGSVDVGVTSSPDDSQQTVSLAESPVPRMTAEEVQIFEANSISIEAIRPFQDRPDFRQQIDRKLAEFRNQQKPLTPEEQAQREVEEKTKEIKELEKQQAVIDSLPEDTEENRILKNLRRQRINEELDSLRGGGRRGDGGSEGSGGSEGPPKSPDNRLEYEASPERGRQIVEEIVKWEGRRAAGKLDNVEWDRLDDLYLQHEIHMEAARIVSLRRRPSKSKQSSPTHLEIKLVNKEALAGFRSVNEWITDYEEGAINDWGRFNKEIGVYFKQAHDAGLLKDLDRTLAAAWRGIKIGIGRNQDSGEINSRVEPGIQAALDNITSYYRNRQREDREIQNLAVVDQRTNRLVVDPRTRRIAGIWDLYLELARGKFADAVERHDVDMVIDYAIENEFHLGREEDESGPKETFWHLEHGWYIVITAQTEAEFMIAADTYISRLQAITSDAKKITQEASQFIDILAKSEGAKKLLDTNPEFVSKLIWGIEARVGNGGADDANDRYNGVDYKAFLDFVNKDGKGPDRWLTLLGMLDGHVAAALWKLDKDPRYELLFATYGSRGQLAKMSIAQRDRITGQGIHNQVYNMLVKEIMGVQIRNKDDRDDLTSFMSDRKFVEYFDGLYAYDLERENADYGDVNIRAYRDAKGKSNSELTSDQRQSMRNGAIRLGRIQLELRNLENRILNGEKFQKKWGKNAGEAYNPEKDKLTNLLKNESDANFYNKAFADAKKAVDIAFQMYGALGEKSKRAGGVFMTDWKIDTKGKKYRYYVPIHWTEKWVQTAETLTKMQCAKLSAKERTAKVAEARRRNIEIFKQDGYEAQMVDADGKIMKLKRPKEDPSQLDGLARDENGNTTPEETTVDFYTATHHAYGNWTGHTYWSYQEEHRHLLLSPTMFAQAKEIRDGKLRSEDADPVAVQLLILDPTLRRVMRFENGFEDRERKLTMAAVEDSYQSHWRITRELHRVFWPKTGTPTKDIGIYYGLQDYGGFRKTIESLRARIAEDPARFDRRGKRFLPDLHDPVATFAEYLGQGSVGAMGALRMMGYPMYRLAGTFALDKFAVNAEMGARVSDALIGTYNPEAPEADTTYTEGLLLKPTNNSDKLQAYSLKDYTKLLRTNPAEQDAFCFALLDTFGRLAKYEKLLTTMETAVRNASGALQLEKVDILTDKGALNSRIESALDALPAVSWVSISSYIPEGEKITAGKEATRVDLANFITGVNQTMRETKEDYHQAFNADMIDNGIISLKTGSGRQSSRIFHDAFMDIMLDESEGGGLDMYKNERFFLKHIDDFLIYYDPNSKVTIDGLKITGVAISDKKIRDWLHEKMVPT